jgi:hypothetical protein
MVNYVTSQAAKGVQMSTTHRTRKRDAFDAFDSSGLMYYIGKSPSPAKIEKKTRKISHFRYKFVDSDSNLVAFFKNRVALFVCSKVSFLLIALMQ